MSRWRLVAGSGLIAALALAWPVSAGAQVRSTDLALAASQNPSDAEAPPVPAAVSTAVLPRTTGS